MSGADPSTMPSRPEVERALLRAGSTPSQEEAEAFYARRVSDYAHTVGGVFLGLYLIGIVGTAIFIPGAFWAIHLHPAKLFNVGFSAAALFISYVTRRPNAPVWLVMGVDVALPTGVTLGFALLAPTVPPAFAFYFFPLLVAVMFLVVRAAVVPSLPRRTVAVGIAACIPVVIAGYELAAKSEPPLAVGPALIAAAIAVWCLGVIVVTAFVSRVIYGLHREIASAKKLGQYVMGELIGEGGMGAVYHAQHAMLRRPTAVKLLLPERAGPENIARFEREVQLTARLTHPNTVAVYDYGRTPDGVFYYAMEYLDGLSLEQLVERFGPQSDARVIHLLLQASGALLEAHSLGLIHRDVKPANMLLCERGGTPDMLKLLDFGLVKNLVPSQNLELTHTDAITGTPQYLAPESILEPSTIDARVDLYALGGVGYFLLCGEAAFGGQSVLEVCGHHLHTVPELPSLRLGAPVLPELEALVMRCLEKDRDRRPEDAHEVHEALLACAQKAPWSRSEAHAFWRAFRAEPRSSVPARKAPGQSSDTRTDAL